MNEYEVWNCKVVIPAGSTRPRGFDRYPRRAAINAIESVGVEVISCFSGMGGKLTEHELEVVKNTKGDGVKIISVEIDQ